MLRLSCTVSAHAALAKTTRDINRFRRARPSVDVARHQAKGSCGAGSDKDIVQVIPKNVAAYVEDVVTPRPNDKSADPTFNQTTETN
jgi:hypothetical protein